MITEAGGLIGNFTGESDYLHQREIVPAIQFRRAQERSAHDLAQRAQPERAVILVPPLGSARIRPQPRLQRFGLARSHAAFISNGSGWKWTRSASVRA